MTKNLNLRDQKKEKTRLEIYTAAAQLFSTNGYSAVSVEDIAEKAFVSRTTIYNYFSINPKDELYFGLGTNGFKQTNAYAEQNILTKGNGMDQFLTLCERAFEAIQTFPLIFTILSDYFLKVKNDESLNFEAFHDEIKNPNNYLKMHKQFEKEVYLLDFYIQLQKSAEIWLTAIANGKNDGSIKNSLPDDHIVHFLNLTLTGIIEQTILRQPTLTRIEMDQSAIVETTVKLIKTFLQS